MPDSEVRNTMPDWLKQWLIPMATFLVVAGGLLWKVDNLEANFDKMSVRERKTDFDTRWNKERINQILARQLENRVESEKNTEKILAELKELRESIP